MSDISVGFCSGVKSVACLVFSKFLKGFCVVMLFVCRDFAIRNCLVCADMTIKVGDYGLAEELFNVRGCTQVIFLFLG